MAANLIPVRLFLLSAMLGVCMGGSPASAQQVEAPATPAALFGDLYVDVEAYRVFPDNKIFADAVPRSAPADIVQAYDAEHPRDIAEFVKKNFILPADIGLPAPIVNQKTGLSISEHIDRLWDVLRRHPDQTQTYSSLLPLPFPYIVPGGRFREVYYWDSYFTLLELAKTRPEIVEGMVKNFAYLIDTYGHIPNGNRTYYLSRSQPPFFFKMVEELSQGDDAAVFAQYLPQLKREYAYWMEGAETLVPGTAHRHVVRLPDGALLNRYWDDLDTPRDESYFEDVVLAQKAKTRDPHQVDRDVRAAAESGWDFSSRWLADANNLATIHTTELLPVDLNSLLFGLENAIKDGCRKSGDMSCAEDFEHRAALRHAAVNHYLWDAAHGTYGDYDWVAGRLTGRVSAAIVYPLFFGMADQHQATAVADVVRQQLLKKGGVVTTPLTTGQQWDTPNGWAPLQWLSVAGFNRYGLQPLATNIACRWMASVAFTYRQSEKLVEKYDVLNPDRAGGGGEYPLQDGFGWTNGVMSKLMELYALNPGDKGATPCPVDPWGAAAGNPGQ